MRWQGPSGISAGSATTAPSTLRIDFTTSAVTLATNRSDAQNVPKRSVAKTTSSATERVIASLVGIDTGIHLGAVEYITAVSNSSPMQRVQDWSVERTFTPFNTVSTHYKHCPPTCASMLVSQSLVKHILWILLKPTSHSEQASDKHWHSVFDFATWKNRCLMHVSCRTVIFKHTLRPGYIDKWQVMVEKLCASYVFF